MLVYMLGDFKKYNKICLPLICRTSNDTILPLFACVWIKKWDKTRKKGMKNYKNRVFMCICFTATVLWANEAQSIKGMMRRVKMNAVIMFEFLQIFPYTFFSCCFYGSGTIICTYRVEMELRWGCVFILIYIYIHENEFEKKIALEHNIKL